MRVALAEAGDRQRYGGKAAQLAQALAAGLPVPDGHALSWEGAAALSRGERTLAPLPPGSTWAVRSSALDEDGAQASFAGQHQSLLHVPAEAVPAAVAQVVASGADPGAQAYRARVGAAAGARMRAAGLMFTRNPMNGAAERWIEASWGPGEAVVQGLVSPDQWRLHPNGGLIEARPGHQDIEVVAAEGGGTLTRPVEEARAAAPCLDAEALGRLHALAQALDACFHGAHDVEFAFDGAHRLWLLQRREITR